MPEEGSAKQNLGDPPAIIVQVIIGPARQKWDIPRSNPGDIYLYYILKAPYGIIVFSFTKKFFADIIKIS